MTQQRVTAGVPTGGQFAAGVHTESGVTLGAAQPSPEMDVAAEEQALTAELAAYTALGDRIESRAARVLAAKVRQAEPSAKYVELEVTDQGGVSMVAGAIRSADGQVLAESTYDLDDGAAADEIDWLAACLTEGGAWSAATTGQGTDLDLDLAAALDIPAPAPGGWTAALGTAPAAEPTFEQRWAQAEESVTEHVTQLAPGAVSWTAHSEEWDNGFYFGSDVEATMPDGSVVVVDLSDTPAADALTELSVLESPGRYSEVTAPTGIAPTGDRPAEHTAAATTGVRL